MEDVLKLHAAWCKSLQQAVDTDAWGQVLEAVEAYERFETIEKVIVSMEMRVKCLSSVDGQRKPTKEDMEDVLEGALSDEPEVFPLDVSRAMRAKTRGSMDKAKDVGGDTDLDECAAAELVNATTQVAVLRSPGATYLDIRITKIGLKDASVYVNPTMAVSVFDYSGKAMEETRETGVGECKEPQYVTFNTNIQLATNLRKMEDHGAAITFEFFHYKAKKRKKSCRCWALLEMDEIKDGPAVLELYQKPMDPKRKRIHLFTEKELYLQLELRLQTL
ncbi:axin interactor, putative [Phytophthora infestans T30-4]|uniref:Axin interactor, putative n=1 Tax=Phytophthora infestans (strain T30-4) TaxID=403677 RepID=D0NFF2_PHYIT|nr:axin interactor, putative [Phytophthora infestans T30-4]EEY56941.1 axin interactor, putative [Phytophthora infestans T30-4]|eukprot:XP_002902269.1 axin interactor, putative [Phytophthora infestans T30-4]